VTDPLSTTAQAAQESILCVDDERPILSALRRLLRRTGHPVLLAGSGAEALQILAARGDDDPVALVISDMRMPQMSGAELLEQVAQRWPDSQRILLTGQADLDATVAAINEGRICRYLNKPWGDRELLEAVAAALAERRHKLRARADHRSLREDKARLEQSLREQACELLHTRSYQPLTRLPNRNLLLTRIGAALAADGDDRRGQQLAVLCVGLEGLQRISESLGYEAGDALLLLVAERLQSLMPGADTVAHFGGEQFGLLLCGTQAAEEAGPLGDRLLQQLGMPYVYQGQELYLGASIGIEVQRSTAPAGSGGAEADLILRNAEAAQRQARAEGGNRCCRFDVQMNLRTARKLAMEVELRRALAEGELCLHYQPRVRWLPDGDGGGIRTLAAEALLRWQHPEDGLIPPGQFVPVLEETGLIERAGDWLIGEACATLGRLRAAGFGDIGVAVNLSARQFDSGRLADLIQSHCTAHGVATDAGLLELEITENLLMRDVGRADQTLRGLADAGFVIAIDDFGTGYSSLGYLARFPVSCLKIDRSFVIDIDHSSTAQAIVRAVTSLAQALGLQLICEGVETAAQRDALFALGCDEFQGFLFSRPLAEGDFLAWLVAERDHLADAGRHRQARRA